jgi:hypothetical protein
VEQAEQLVPITFLVIVGTVAIYGLAAAPLASRLQLSDSNPQGILFAGAAPWIRNLAGALQDEGYPVLLVDTNYSHVAAARMEGIPAECCSILSEHVQEELDLNGIGRLLAVTPNDEVNALAVRELAHVFGRANVYQLAPWDERAGRRASVSEHLRGRTLFDKNVHHGTLLRRFESGARIKKTRLTEEFSGEQFAELYGESSMILFLAEDGGKLRIGAEDDSLSPQPGHTIIALVDDPGENEPTVGERGE